MLLFAGSSVGLLSDFLSSEGGHKKGFICRVVFNRTFNNDNSVLFAFLLSALKMRGMLNSVESIMCKFAFGYVLCLTFFALNNKEGNDE